MVESAVDTTATRVIARRAHRRKAEKGVKTNFSDPVG
jgi:hypothetical protein